MTSAMENSEIDQSSLLDRAAELVEAAAKAGADACDAISVRSRSLGVSVRNGKIETVDSSENDAISLRVFVGKKKASISANTFDDIESLAQRAVAMARVSPDDPYACLADKDRLATSFPDLELLDNTILGADRLGDMALAAEEAAMNVDGVSKSGGSGAGESLGGVVLATSHGFSASYQSSHYSCSMTAVAGDGVSMERDYDYTVANHAADLKDPRVIGRSAGDRTVARVDPKTVNTGRMKVIFDPRVATSLMGHLSGAINGAGIARKTSFLMDKLGEQIFQSGIRITDDPLIVRGLGSRPFDGEGVVNEAFDLVTDGVLQTWLLDSATAAELGLKTNGRASRSGANPSPSGTNIDLLPGDRSPEDMINDVGEGLYITDLIGHGVNGLTGDYSRGASGFMIRDGIIAEAVSGFTIAGNLIDMFAELEPASDFVRERSINAPTIFLGELAIAGQ
ncbi:MAG: modulator protein [Hyphomicrobiales bacterium]|nr:MAG: modulator protein [Hyphomicrobiales bacterium]